MNRIFTDIGIIVCLIGMIGIVFIVLRFIIRWIWDVFLCSNIGYLLFCYNFYILKYRWNTNNLRYFYSRLHVSPFWRRQVAKARLRNIKDVQSTIKNYSV